MEIPLKKVVASQIIKKYNRGLKAKIKDLNYIGTEFFFLREDIAPKGFLNKVKDLNDIREMNGEYFERFMDPDYYKCSDDEVSYGLLNQDKIIVLNTEIGNIGINYLYYSYFKKLSTEFRFKDKVDPIGIFKNKEFIGILLPVKIREE